jgi:hypothetical protein
MKEDLRERAGVLPDAATAAPLAPLPPATQARRRRLVRVFGLLTILTTVGLSLIPQNDRVRSVTSYDTGAGDRSRASVVVTYDRALGRPFNTATSNVGEGGEIRSLSVHPEGVLGNLAIAMGVYGTLMFLLGRRRRDT